jgi:lycopene cyclase domain-containing protein
VNKLYLLLNIGSILVPFLVSFHPRLKFYKKWSSFFIAVIITSVVFIIWDVFFLRMGIWGFNPDYYLGYTFFGLPMEEWMFFLFIPYSCIFMHYSLLELFPKFSYNQKRSKQITVLLLGYFTVSLILNYNKWYPLVNYILAIALLLLVYTTNKNLLKTYYKTFVIMLIPFVIVNGVLTGTGINDQVVWYNNLENCGVRFFTIPIEDATYAFTMILSTLYIIDFLEKRKKHEDLN